MEEFVNGHVETFDGITDLNKNVLLCSSHVMLNSIMDVVNLNQDSAFYSQNLDGTKLKEVGLKAVQAFDTRSRFFHFEFFVLDQDKEGLGKKGDIVGLEVNMRAPGAFIPNVINYTFDCDVYAVWADMLIYDRCFIDPQRKYYVGYASRRHNQEYLFTHDELVFKMKDALLEEHEVNPVLAKAMGDHIYLFRSVDKDHLFKMMKDILERR